MEKNRNTILGFYAILSLIVIFSSVPDFRVQNIGYALVFIELIVAYVARNRWPRNESFEENHSTYIIRTIWIYSFIMTIGVIFIGTFIAVNFYHNFDPQVLGPMLSDNGNNSVEGIVQKYMNDNGMLIKNMALGFLFPSQLYLVWRILQGGGRAFKNYRLANPKKWF